MVDLASYTREDEERDLEGFRSIGIKVLPQPEFVLTCLADVDCVAIDWLWPGYLARGKLTLLGGDPDQGKSNITIDIASRLSDGRHMPFGPQPICPGSTVFLCSEDGLADTIWPRAEAAGADLNMLHSMDSCILREGELTRFTLENDLELLGRAVQQVDASLVIIDAITSYMGKADHNSTTAVRGVLDPISAWAEKLNVSVLGVTHPPKATQANAIRQFTGSFAYVAAARIAFFVTKDPENNRSLLLPVKNNIGQKSLGRAYRIKCKDINPYITAPYIEWDDSPVDYTADEAISANRTASSNKSKLQEAKDFLIKFLKNGPQPCDKCRDASRSEAISEMTLRRAREELSILLVKPSGQPEMWQLPPDNVIPLRSDDD